jgi:hypothetical protein
MRSVSLVWSVEGLGMATLGFEFLEAVMDETCFGIAVRRVFNRKSHGFWCFYGK